MGDSAKSRKGSSWDHVARVISRADPSFPARIATDLSSGEGLIWAVRDPVGTDPTSASGEDRLLVLEPEFASVLKNASRDISTLSPVLRCAWDGRPLALLTRTAPARAQSEPPWVPRSLRQTQDGSNQLNQHYSSCPALPGEDAEMGQQIVG